MGAPTFAVPFVSEPGLEAFRRIGHLLCWWFGTNRKIMWPTAIILFDSCVWFLYQKQEVNWITKSTFNHETHAMCITTVFQQNHRMTGPWMSQMKTLQCWQLAVTVIWILNRLYQVSLMMLSELNDLVRDFDLWKTNAELLGSRLQEEWCLLSPGMKISLFRRCQSDVTKFFWTNWQCYFLRWHRRIVLCFGL